ncbi:hypothetical protein V6N11_034678 [Hibiscus sabdariffa]|uniref:Uncharacterized protein n=1 Tax=Hibiscus sabdariffa TaxID=183260 RepID=A0ABR2NDS8_9ROSI
MSDTSMPAVGNAHMGSAVNSVAPVVSGGSGVAPAVSASVFTPEQYQPILELLGIADSGLGGAHKRYWFIPAYWDEDLQRMPTLQGLEFPSKPDLDSQKLNPHPQPGNLDKSCCNYRCGSHLHCSLLHSYRWRKPHSKLKRQVKTFQESQKGKEKEKMGDQ